MIFFRLSNSCVCDDHIWDMSNKYLWQNVIVISAYFFILSVNGILDCKSYTDLHFTLVLYWLILISNLHIQLSIFHELLNCLCKLLLCNIKYLLEQSVAISANHLFTLIWPDFRPLNTREGCGVSRWTSSTSLPNNTISVSFRN